MKLRFVPVLVLLTFALAAPVQAAPVEREHYSGTYSFEGDCDGFLSHVEVTFEGVFMLKAPRADGAPPYYFDNYHTIETVTANGRTLTIEHQGLYKDLHITWVSGTVYQVVSIETGQPFVIRDSEGNVLIRDSGLLKTTFQVDTKGDTDLSNDFFIEGSWSLLAEHGRHPGFDFDFCGFLKDYFLS